VTIILSIKPYWINKIISGEKTFELRKKIPINTSKIIIYATAPISKIIGIIYPGKIIHTDIFSLYEITKCKTGATDDEFLDYFCNKEKGYAVEIKKIKLFKNQYRIKNPPQNFRYFKLGLLYI